MAAKAVKDSGMSSLGNNSKEDETRNEDGDALWKRRNARKWVATIWVAAEGGSGAPADFAGFDAMCRKVRGLSKWTGQIEKCPKSGKLHWQCYFEFEKCVRAGPVFELIFGQNYFRPAKCGKQAISYSTKSESRHAGPWAWSADGDTKWAENDGEFVSTQKPKKEESITCRDSITISEEQRKFNYDFIGKMLGSNRVSLTPPNTMAMLEELRKFQDLQEWWVREGIITLKPGTPPQVSGSKPDSLPVPDE